MVLDHRCGNHRWPHWDFNRGKDENRLISGAACLLNHIVASTKVCDQLKFVQSINRRRTPLEPSQAIVARESYSKGHQGPLQKTPETFGHPVHRPASC